MDIQAIEDNIKILEEEPTTVDNVQKLACLYTVYDKLKLGHHSNDDSYQELLDIMPAFHDYCDARRQHQLGQSNDEAVEHTLKLLCQELEEFISTLYANTSSRRQRLSLLYLTKSLYERFNR